MLLSLEYLCKPSLVLTQIYKHVTDGISNDDERPRAYVVLKPDQGATAEDIIKFMDGKVTTVKRITGGVVFTDAIPKNPSGKILRKELRERARKEMKGVTAKL